jgi:hypothetical protein
MRTRARVIAKLVVIAVICVVVAATAFNLVERVFDGVLGELASDILATIASAIAGVAAVMLSSQLLRLRIHDDDMPPN